METVIMRPFLCVAVLFAMLAPYAQAKNEKPAPQTFLIAHSIAVMIDPAAGINVSDPNANEVARKDVETALLSWGRFFLTINVDQADLVVVIRKGNGKLVNQTINDPRQNNRPGSVQTTPGAISIGVQHGKQAGVNDSPGSDQAQSPRTQAEVGSGEDSFLVYEGTGGSPLVGAPGWRSSVKDGLHAHNIPAVEQFKAAIAEAEKLKAAAKKTPGNTPANTPSTTPGHP